MVALAAPTAPPIPTTERTPVEMPPVRRISPSEHWLDKIADAGAYGVPFDLVGPAIGMRWEEWKLMSRSSSECEAAYAQGKARGQFELHRSVHTGAVADGNLALKVLRHRFGWQEQSEQNKNAQLTKLVDTEVELAKVAIQKLTLDDINMLRSLKAKVIEHEGDGRTEP